MADIEKHNIKEVVETTNNNKPELSGDLNQDNIASSKASNEDSLEKINTSCNYKNNSNDSHENNKLKLESNPSELNKTEEENSKSQMKNSLEENRIKSTHSTFFKYIAMQNENIKHENTDEALVRNGLRQDGGVSNQGKLEDGKIEINVKTNQNDTKTIDLNEKNKMIIYEPVEKLNDEAEQDRQLKLTTENESFPIEKNSDFETRKISLFSYYHTDIWEEKLKSQKESVARNYVTLNIMEITDALKIGNEFTNDNINLSFSKKFLSNENENHERMYLSHLTDTKFTYDGILNKNFEKNIIGKNKFANGDVYIGDWKNDKKDGFGVYFYNIEGDDALPELFCGEFEDNGKKKEGFYFNSTGHQLPEGALSFDAFEGNFDSNENLHQGTFISLNKDVTKSYVYLGDFSGNKKHDENSYYYLFNSRLLFIGKFEQDNITQGHLFELSPEKQIKSVVKYNSSSGKREVDNHMDMEDQINKANAFLSKVDSNKIITSVQEISQESLRLKEEWRNKKIKNEDDVEFLSQGLNKLQLILTCSSIKL